MNEQEKKDLDHIKKRLFYSMPDNLVYSIPVSASREFKEKAADELDYNGYYPAAIGVDKDIACFNNEKSIIFLKKPECNNWKALEELIVPASMREMIREALSYDGGKHQSKSTLKEEGR